VSRKPITRAGIGAAAATAACLVLWACGSLQSPTHPEPTPDAGGGVPAPTPSANPLPTPTPVLGRPAPAPTPTPSATPEPEPSASPTAAPPNTSGCGSPTPPELSQINVKIHLRGANAWTLDSTPLVGPDPDYCALIGFTDGRAICPVRPEGNPEREACELYVTGVAKDTGRPGPTWYFGSRLCTGPGMGCENHPDNQYQLLVYEGGVFKACGRNGVCGEVTVDR
jgi:hypothetical protein